MTIARICQFSVLFILKSHKGANNLELSNDYNQNISSWTVSEVEILEMLDSLNEHSGMGSDSIPPLFLKSF